MKVLDIISRQTAAKIAETEIRFQERVAGKLPNDSVLELWRKALLQLATDVPLSEDVEGEFEFELTNEAVRSLLTPDELTRLESHESAGYEGPGYDREGFEE